MRHLLQTSSLGLALALLTACPADKRLTLVKDSGSTVDTGSAFCEVGLVCGGECVNTNSNAAHCGGCNRACRVDQDGAVSVRCMEGRCVPSCDRDAGWELCNARCAYLANDPRHCGACGRLCNAEGTREAPLCLDGRCNLVCADLRGDCNGLADDGCEVTLTTTAHCGQCGRVCDHRGNGTGGCDDTGNCSIVCNGSGGPDGLGFDRCDLPNGGAVCAPRGTCSDASVPAVDASADAALDAG